MYYYYVIDAICSVADTIYFLFLVGSFLSRRKAESVLFILASCIFGAVLIILSFWPDLTLPRACYWIIGGTVLVFAFFRTKFLPALFLSLSFIAIGGLTEIVVMILFSFFGINNADLMQPGNARLLFIIDTHFVELLVVLIVRAAKNIITGDVSAKILLPSLPCLIVSTAFCCLLASDISKNADLNPLYLIITLGFLYTCIIIIAYSIRLQNQENVRHSLELANHHYTMQKEYYEQLHSQQEQTRALWHDIKKYLLAIQADTASNSSLKELEDIVNSISPVVDVGNRVASIILNEYLRLANDVGATLSLDVQIPPELPVTAADLYIILGNTLDNALDACALLPPENRAITLQLRMQNQLLFYRISNPQPTKNSLKEGIRFHGYGLKNVEACVQRNNGTMDIGTENGAFTVTVLLNCL